MQFNQTKLFPSIVSHYFNQAEICEKYWNRDNYMATKIQAYFRMYVLHKAYKRNQTAAICIQKYCRAYLARQLVHNLLSRARNLKNIKYYAQQAKTIQRYFRGFSFRKYQHDFYLRKQQLQKLNELNDQFKIEIYDVARRERLEEEKRQEEQAKQEFLKLAKNLHHLTSTFTQPGIYKPPFAKENPKAFDVEVETHLKTAFKTNHDWKCKRSNSGFKIRPQSQKTKIR